MEKSYFGEFQDFGYPKLANPLVNANRLRTSKTVFEKVKWVKLIIENLLIPQFPQIFRASRTKTVGCTEWI